MVKTLVSRSRHTVPNFLEIEGVFIFLLPSFNLMGEMAQCNESQNFERVTHGHKAATERSVIFFPQIFIQQSTSFFGWKDCCIGSWHGPYLCHAMTLPGLASNLIILCWLFKDQCRKVFLTHKSRFALVVFDSVLGCLHQLRHT